MNDDTSLVSLSEASSSETSACVSANPTTYMLVMNDEEEESWKRKTTVTETQDKQGTPLMA